MGIQKNKKETKNSIGLIYMENSKLKKKSRTEEKLSLNQKMSTKLQLLFLSLCKIKKITTFTCIELSYFFSMKETKFFLLLNGLTF